MYKFSTMKNGSLKQFQKYRQGCWKRLLEPLFFIGYQGKYKTEFDATCKMMVYKKNLFVDITV